MMLDARAAHFVGQRLLIEPRELGKRFTPDRYSVEFWCYNAMPCDVRETTGYLFSLGPLDDGQHIGDHLAIGGKGDAAGKLVFQCGGNANSALLVGKTVIPMREWTLVALTRNGSKISVHLNGDANEISGNLDTQITPDIFDKSTICIGGRSDGACNFEGKICMAAFYDRPLESITDHYAIATR